jgi:hypothetical protein
VAGIQIIYLEDAGARRAVQSTRAAQTTAWAIITVDSGCTQLQLTPLPANRLRSENFQETGHWTHAFPLSCGFHNDRSWALLLSVTLRSHSPLREN